jgi:hypothetical protein
VAAKRAASEKTQGVLDNLTGSITGAPTEQQATQIDLLKAKLLELKPTLEELAATSNSWTVGWDLGVQKIADSTKTGAQLIGDTMFQLADGLAKSGSAAFNAWVTGSKSVGQAFREMMSQIALSIADVLIEAVIMAAILGAINAIPLVGPAVVAIIGAAAVANYTGALNAAPKYAEGGRVNADGLAVTHESEFVVRKSGSRRVGYPFLEKLNRGIIDMRAIGPDALIEGMAAPITSAGGGGAWGGSGMQPVVNVAPTPITVIPVHSREDMMTVMASRGGKKVIYDTVKAALIDLGVRR